MELDTEGVTKGFGVLRALVRSDALASDFTVTIDGEAVEVTTNISTPIRAIEIHIPRATGAIMTAVISGPSGLPWSLFGWLMTRYDCLAKNVQDITIPFP